MKKIIALSLSLTFIFFWACSDDNGDDTQAPTVSILSPSNGELVSQTFTVDVEAQDNESIDYVELYIDGSLHDEDADAPYSFDLALTETEGTITLMAKAIDDAGNVTDSEEISVTIDPYAENFNLSVVGASSGSIQLLWNSYGGPFAIYVLRKSESSGVSVSSTVVDTFYSREDTTKTVTGLSVDTDYFFRVWAVRTDGLSVSTNEAHGHTDTASVATTDTTMIYIPASTFSRGNSWGGAMGGNDDTPTARISVNAFYIDKFEVTYRQYQEFVDAGGYENEEYWSAEGWSYIHDLLDMQPGFWENDMYHQGDDYPVVGVSFFEAEAYANWKGKRLPTEAEWELAARGTGGEDVDDDTHTDGFLYPWGNEFYMDSQVHCNFNDSETPYDDGFVNNAPIGSFPSGDSPYGVSDMSGNLAEWCADWWDPEYYDTSPTDNPTGPSTGERKIVRGGSFIDLPGQFTDEGFDFRTFIRDYREPGDQKKQIGFRCVRDAD